MPGQISRSGETLSKAKGFDPRAPDDYDEAQVQFLPAHALPDFSALPHWLLCRPVASDAAAGSNEQIASR